MIDNLRVRFDKEGDQIIIKDHACTHETFACQFLAFILKILVKYVSHYGTELISILEVLANIFNGDNKNFI